MRRRDRLLAKARNSPNGLSFREFESLLARCGWIFDHQTGSHRIWYSPYRYRLPVQSKRGQAKGYQVKEFLMQYDQETQNE
ncbi:type II toxin-antitoxin system HicA family toxin [Candidatus Poribacteria bacterium]|nr:type II toxin-antitoxin system HicA family toxin [Candidatus Poribacteria bacterium]MYA58040.1 type II toxin-antitoxin system HicA family toxin [Candidatus Poribacteria bacterium]